MTFGLALRNIFRSRLRTFIALLSLAGGTASLIFIDGYFEDTFLKMRESYIYNHTGHLQIFQKEFRTKGHTDPLSYMINNPDIVVSEIEKWNEVYWASPRIRFPVLLSTEEETLSAVGEGIISEHSRLSHKESAQLGRKAFDTVHAGVLESGQDLRDSNFYEVNLGLGLAKKLKVKIGDPLTLMAGTVEGSLNAFDVSTRGIFITAAKTYDDIFFRIPLDSALDLLRTESVQNIIVLLKNSEDTRKMEHRINKLIEEHNWPYEVVHWRDLNEYFKKTESMFNTIFFILRIVLGFIIILSIYNTIHLLIKERTVELGTIRAMGASQSKLVKILLTEGVVLGVLGGVIGSIFGIGLTLVVGWIGIDMPPPPEGSIGWVSEPLLTLKGIATALIFSVVVAILSSVGPAFVASKNKIADSLRYAG